VVVSRRRFFGMAAGGALCAQVRLDPGRIDAIAREELAAQGVPGVSVAVLADGQTYTQGYGVRSLDGRKPVTPRTLFATGSLTKSFTALVGAMLVAEGKLDWDRPAREYLPWFKMYDPLATAQINVRDMLCHRSGLPRYDFLRFALMLDRVELVRRIQYLPPTAGFRAKWQYNNLMYCVAGLIEAEVARMPWEDLMEKRIFGPFEMNDSNVRVSETRQSADFALPHERAGGKIDEVDFYDYQKFGVGPNGAVNSTANDLAKYLRFHLAGSPLLDQVTYPQMVVDRLNNYGLGWWIQNSDGLLSHSGSITGFRAYAQVDRRRNFAAAVLANGPLNARLIHRLREAVTGQAPPPAPAAPRPAEKPAAATAAPPSAPLAAFAGRYEHPAFGACDVTASGGRLHVKFPAYASALAHAGGDHFRDSAGREVEFAKADMRYRVEPEAPPFRFSRAR
jgi:CubicO group peptidase (beta-lactamase class C family)